MVHHVRGFLTPLEVKEEEQLVVDFFGTLRYTPLRPGRIRARTLEVLPSLSRAFSFFRLHPSNDYLDKSYIALSKKKSTILTSSHTVCGIVLRVFKDRVLIKARRILHPASSSWLILHAPMSSSLRFIWEIPKLLTTSLQR